MSSSINKVLQRHLINDVTNVISVQEGREIEKICRNLSKQEVKKGVEFLFKTHATVAAELKHSPCRVFKEFFRGQGKVRPAPTFLAKTLAVNVRKGKKALGRSGLDHGDVNPGRLKPKKMLNLETLETLTPEKIREVIRGKVPLLKAYFQNAKHANPGLKGKLVVHFSISKEGRITASAVERDGSTLRNKKFEEGILRLMKTFQFPKPQGELVSATYTFDF